jgi:hypothetical protein
MFGCFLWAAIATVRRRYRAGWQYSLRSLFIAILVVAAFLGVAQALGARRAGLLLAAALQLLTPVAVVGLDARSRSPWSAAAVGAAAAWVSVLVYVVLYGLLFGIPLPYPFGGDAGPGLRGFPGFVVAFFIYVLSFKMFPVVAILLAGAIGGVVGWGLRRRIAAKSDLRSSGRLAKASLILFVIAAAILLVDIIGPVLLSSGGAYGIELDGRLHDQLQFLAFLSLPFIFLLLAIGSFLGTTDWRTARKASARPSRMTVVAASLNLASLLIGTLLILAFILFLVGPTTDVVPRWPGR